MHEHLDSASSWTDEECIKAMLARDGVHTVVTDRCQFGQKSREGHPVKKPTRWMSNCPGILEAPDRRCAGRGGVRSATHTHTPHQQCSGRTAREAAIYPFAMCRAILEGLRQYLTNQGRRRDGINAVLPPDAFEAAASGTVGEEALMTALAQQPTCPEIQDCWSPPIGPLAQPTCPAAH